MLPRRKNLLEASKKWHAAGAPPGPAPPPAPPPRAPPTGPLFESVARSAGVGRQPAPALILVGLVFAFALGFVAGRSTGGEAQAEEKSAAVQPPVRRLPPVNQPRAFQEQPASARTETPAAERRIEESALFDPANLHTVVVAAYSSNNQDLAWATYEHLHELGLPVFPPVASKNLILVLVGAAPTAGELAETEATVKALQRDGQKAYETAYRARIDALIPRTSNARTSQQGSK